MALFADIEQPYKSFILTFVISPGIACTWKVSQRKEMGQTAEHCPCRLFK